MDVFDRRTIVYVMHCVLCVFIRFYVMCNVFTLFYSCVYFVRNDEIKLWYSYLNTFTINFDIIVLSEIGARNLSTVENLLPNYDFYYTIPTNNNYGGVGIYISNNMNSVSIREDLSILKSCDCCKCEFESLFVKFKYRGNKFFLRGLYRHPNGKVNHLHRTWKKHLLK